MTEPKNRFVLEPWNRGISVDALIRDLQRVAAEIGSDSLTYDQYDSIGQVRARTVEVRFGSWNRALSAAGLKVVRKVGISDEELFENLQSVWIRLGRQPRRRELVKPLSRFGKTTYEHRFGTWRASLERFVQWVNEDTSTNATIDLSAPSYTAKHRTPRFPSLRLRYRVFLRDRFTCQHCGKSPSSSPGLELHVDHKHAYSQGGETILENLQTLCSQCNIGKSDLGQEQNPSVG